VPPKEWRKGTNKRETQESENRERRKGLERERK
jgi:hypothetical protein